MPEKNAKVERNLEELFRHPPNSFRMMPFWFWNHEMVEHEVQRQIEEHLAHGIGGEFIHPRHGRLTPYLGQRWMENVEAAADKCKELGMDCYLYDEDNWPSGPVGGRITGPYKPENRGKFLAIFDEDEWPGGTHVDYQLDYKQISPESTFYGAIALPAPANYPDFSDVVDRQVDISTHVDEHGKLIWDVPEGPDSWTVIFVCQLVNHYAAELNGYIDILCYATVTEFIEETHAIYVQWFKDQGKEDYLGTVIPGIFTDEPSMAHMSAASGGMFLKWVTFTPEMPGEFEEMFGYPFNDILVSLFYDTGAIAAKHRCAYWRCATDMYVDSFYKQIYEYCDAVNLATTGHVNCEGSFPSHFRNQGDFFKVFEYMHYGGCDQLTEDVRPDYFEPVANLETNPYTGMANEMVVASKLASSAAHLLDKPRVLVEAFGTASWDITLASAKRVNDFLVATGCDLFVPHDFAYSEDGYRKQDHPASFCHQPYYVYWKNLCDHSARLCTILNAASGTLQASALYLYPSNGFYAEMMPHDSDLATLFSWYFNHNADCLMRQQLDFEFANEDLILGGEVIGNAIKIRDQSFPLLFLGMTTCTTLKLAKMVKKFFEEGGKVYACGCLPFKDPDVGESAELASVYESVFGVNPLVVYKNFCNDGGESFKLFVNQSAVGGKAVFLQTPRQNPVHLDYYPRLEQAMRQLLPLDARECVIHRTTPDAPEKSHAQYVIKCSKKIKGDYFYFLANTSREANYPAARVVINRPAEKIELWDTLSGEIRELETFAVKDGKTSFTADFPPYQSYLFRVIVAPDKTTTRENETASSLVDSSEVLAKHEFEPKWSIDLQGANCAMLFEDWISTYKVEAGKAWGYNSERVFTNSFYASNLADLGPVRLVIEGLTGDYAWGKTTYAEPKGGDCAHFEMPSSLKFTLNGKPFSPRFNFEKKFVDPGWIVHDVTSLLQEGRNEISMTCTTRNHQTFHVITDPWRLVGKFAVGEKNGKPHLHKPNPLVELKDLREQEQARFFGGFGYQQGLVVPETFRDKRVTIEITDTTDCVEVHVNGKLVDVMWHRWETDITEHIKVGQPNNFKLVYYGIAQNLLQTNTKPQGICGTVILKAYAK